MRSQSRPSGATAHCVDCNALTYGNRCESCEIDHLRSLPGRCTACGLGIAEIGKNTCRACAAEAADELAQRAGELAWLRRNTRPQGQACECGAGGGEPCRKGCAHILRAEMLALAGP